MTKLFTDAGFLVKELYKGEDYVDDISGIKLDKKFKNYSIEELKILTFKIVIERKF